MQPNDQLKPCDTRPLTSDELQALWMFYSIRPQGSVDRVLDENGLLRLIDAIYEEDQDTTPESSREHLSTEFARHIMMNVLQGKSSIR